MVGNEGDGPMILDPEKMNIFDWNHEIPVKYIHFILNGMWERRSCESACTSTQASKSFPSSHIQFVNAVGSLK